MVHKVMAKLKVIALHFRVMGAANAASYIVQRATRRGGLITARIKGTDLDIRLRNDPYDTQIFTQIFIRGELDIDFEDPPGIIIDAGANIGLATLYLKNRYPSARIVSIEPERANFAILLENTRRCADVTCLNNGIWNKECRLRIIDNGDGNASFVTQELANDEYAPDAVDAITIGAVARKLGLPTLDLVKMDIEGSEKQVFEQGYDDWLPRTNNVIVEVHTHLNADGESTVRNAFREGFLVSRSGEYTVFRRKKPLRAS